MSRLVNDRTFRRRSGFQWIVEIEVAEQARPQDEVKPHAPRASVVIPHRDDPENLRRCLSLLAAQTLPAAEFEIIVADNNSACGLASVEKICGARARAVLAPIPGAAEARNAGVAAANGTCLAFLDSDCRPARDWLERGLAALKNAEMVGGRVDVDVEDNNKMTAVEAFETVFAFDFRRYVEQENFAGAGNMFVPRKIFDQVGGFRAGVSEDRDWGERAVKKGFRWTYAPDVIVSHPARRDWPGLRRKWRRITRESYALAREKPFGPLRWVLRSWLVLFSPIVHVPRVLFSPKLHRFSDRVKAIYILFRLRWWRFVESYKVMRG